MSVNKLDTILPALSAVRQYSSTFSSICTRYRLDNITRIHVAATPQQKVLAKQKQRDKSTTTIAIQKRTAAIDSRR